MITIERDARFSKSMIWNAQRTYYGQKGAEAWANDVPFYITSNPFIAHTYAKLIINFIKDCRDQGMEGVFNIVELGTGTGQFSFYLLKQLHAVARTLNWKTLPFRYIMTDFAEKNIAFWQQHPALKQFIEDGTLDFARFDVENDNTINLMVSNEVLTMHNITTPLIVIANYLFDTVINDIFYTKNGKLHETLVSIATEKKNLIDGQPKKWQKVKFKYKNNAVEGNYYKNPNYNALLKMYRTNLQNTYLNFPIAGLNGITNLQKIANGKLFLISSDKGFSTLGELDEMEVPEFDFHGSFSLMVNFHAIGEYFKMLNGDYFLQSSRGGLTTGAFVSGLQFSQTPLTNAVLNDAIEGFSPVDYFNLFHFIEKQVSRADLEALASLLAMSCWDPYVLMQMQERLNDLVDDNDDETIDFIFKKIELVADNFYFIPGGEDVFFAIGNLFYTIDDYTSALIYYHQSLEHFPNEAEETYYNIGLCHYYSNRKKPAANYFKKVLELNPKNSAAKKMLKQK